MGGRTPLAKCAYLPLMSHPVPYKLVGDGLAGVSLWDRMAL